jgi:predicted nuclease with TOPRIM domain
MTKEEIKHFKSLLRQGSLRHMNILLDDKFQKELLTIIKDYEKLQQENKQLNEDIKVLFKENCNKEEVIKRYEDNWNKLKEYIDKTKIKEFEKSYGKRYGKTFTQAEIIVCNMILDKMQELERGISDVED